MKVCECLFLLLWGSWTFLGGPVVQEDPELPYEEETTQKYTD